MAAVVFTSGELADFDQTSFAKITWLQRRLEAKLLSAVQDVISGEAFSAESLAQAIKIQKQVANFTLQKK